MKRFIQHALFFAVALGLLYLTGNQTEEMNDAVRDAAGVASVTLGGVTTAYEVAGQNRAGTAVLIHGASGPGFVWDRTVGALHSAGFRTLRYDIVGRGYSGRYDDAPYDLDFYVAQLKAIIRHVEKKKPVYLVGNSMGCILAVEYANRYSDQVRGLVLIGPAGFPIENPAAALADLPLISDYIMHTFGDRLILAANRKYFIDPAAPDSAAFLKRFEDMLKYRGLKRAMLITMRRMPMQDFSDGYARLGATGKPVLFIWGRADNTFPFQHSARALELIPRAGLYPVDRAAHLPQYERPDVVNEKLIEFLKQE